MKKETVIFLFIYFILDKRERSSNFFQRLYLRGTRILSTLLPLRFLKEMNEFSRDKLESSHDQIWPHLRRQDSWESCLVREPATNNVYIYIYIHIYTHSTDFVPPLCISARLCLALLGGEEAACNANSRYNCRPVHREADLDSSVSRTCQLGVTTPGIVPTFALFAPPFLSTDLTIRDIEIPIQFIQPIPPNRFYYQ